MIPNNVVLITECSSGIGKTLSKEILNSGFSIAATARNKDDIFRNLM